MKNFTIAFLVFIIWSFFGLWFYHWLQQDTMAMYTETETGNTPEAKTAAEYAKERLPLRIENEAPDIVDSPNVAEANAGLTATTEEGDILFRYPENIQIKKNSATVYIPTNTHDFKYKLNSYLLEHTNTELVVVSKYSAEENIESPNYGTQRAQKIKAILIDAGIASQRIVIKPHITPIEFNLDNSYDKAFSFTIQPLDLKRVENIKKAIPETKTIYPRFSSSDILNSPALEKTLQEVVRVFEANPTLKITVVGHTDNIGNATDNYLRGLEFAKQMRWYLVSKGNIDKNKIKAISEGESQAIANNNTEKGRTLNQRIEIKFSEE
ncbi:OmpA family protein [Rasiella sp. SM2506]|uniref:OmpA family protein n=1 Tax=Rasiella sp. SM2506 TaxID=3423914 RepID=UPI003D7B6DEF